MNLRDPEENRCYYRARCGGKRGGDTRSLLDPENYEHPRIAWLLGRVSGTVLDVGCCTGDFCAYLHARGMRCMGLDPRTRHIEVARERYPDVAFLCVFAEEYLERFAARPWDTVTAGDVIEHVPDDAAFLACLLRLGRRVLLTTPNGPWPSPEHLRVYTPESAAALVRSYGGRVEIIHDRDGNGRWLGLDVPRPAYRGAVEMAAWRMP